MDNLPARASRWLNPTRLRWHAAALAVCLWSAYLYDFSTAGLRDRNGLIKGTDFLHFYTLGALALRHQGEWLYGGQAQSRLAAQLVPGSAGTFFLPLYGPQVSLLFAPFAQLTYGWALLAWLELNVVIYFSCCYLVWKSCQNLQGDRWTVFVAAAGFPGFFHLLAWGQSSGLALVCFTGALLALRKNRPWLAGAAIGCLFFKPQLALASAVIFVLAGEGRVVLGAITSAAVQLIVAWAAYGTEVMRSYVAALWQVREVLPLLEPRPYQTHCLRTFWSMLIPWTPFAVALYFICAGGVLLIAIRSWKKQAALPLRYSLLLFATVLVSPHLTVYDLVILAPAFLLLADWITQYPNHRYADSLKLLLYLCYPLFLLGPLSQSTRLQMSVPVMVGITWIAARINSTQDAKRIAGSTPQARPVTSFG
jgi:hypothetical protein